MRSNFTIKEPDRSGLGTVEAVKSVKSYMGAGKVAIVRKEEDPRSTPKNTGRGGGAKLGVAGEEKAGGILKAPPDWPV